MRAAGGAAIGTVSRWVLLLAATVLVLGSASFARPAAGVVVSGTVSGSDQGFLTGASVTVDGPERRSTKTDADGRFTFSDVPRGHYRIAVAADGYLGIERPMEVGDASVSMDIVLLRLPGL
jgi:hypothetical protein